MSTFLSAQSGVEDLTSEGNQPVNIEINLKPPDALVSEGQNTGKYGDAYPQTE